jgi:DNA-binding response OmpR family regulator
VQDKPLSGCRILIVEDDFYQAEDSRSYLTDAGAVIVGCRGTIPDIDALLTSGSVDMALLDINLGHTHTFDLARTLRDKGVRFAFVTGYDPETVPRDLAHVPLITKPTDSSSVIEFVRRALHESGLSDEGLT